MNAPAQGLYSLGEVQEDGHFESACTSGLVLSKTDKKNPGIVLFFLIRHSEGTLRVVYDFIIENIKNNKTRYCKKEFDNSYSPKEKDIIAVYAGQDVKLKNKQSVLISFNSTNKESGWKIFEGSTVAKKTYGKFEGFRNEIKDLIQTHLSYENLKLTNTSLNVEVKILSELFSELKN